MSDCPFCPDNWDNLTHVRPWRGVGITIIKPLRPVTEGHVLVIPKEHVPNAAADPLIAANVMAVAAKYVQHVGDANIITSIGSHATQTVMHTHLHVVPRSLNDGLPLPWTPQQKMCAACEVMDDCACGCHVSGLT